MNTANINVLAIEDSIEDAVLISEMLGEVPEQRFSFFHAKRLSDGLAFLRQQRFDIVLLDLGLPDSQGIETVQNVHSQFPGVPIIVLTGMNDEELAVKALQMEVQDYLTKGRMDRDSLVRSIRYAIERKRATEALRENEEKYRGLFDSMTEAFARCEMVLDSGGNAYDLRYLDVNTAWERLTGISIQNARGKTAGEVSSDMEPSWADVCGLLSESCEPRHFEQYSRLSGRWFEVYAYCPERGYVATFFHDITERKRLEEEVKHLAQHDELTGLPNRRLFREIISVELAQARRHGRRLAVFFLDLDRFKEINDTLGHEAGDELLNETAARLKSVIRVSDTVARIGGDEFNLIIPDITRAEYAAEVAQKIMSEIRKPFLINGHELNVSGSIGISIYPHDGKEADTLLRYADIAMYHAKDRGRNNYQFYNPVINTRSIERIQFENSLRQAIDNNEFRLYFQPLVDVKTGKLVSAEALLRWQHPQRGLLLPRQFFGSAEDIGFMPDIDEWVLQNVGIQIKSWIEQGMPHVCITVNLSARRFQDRDLITRIARVLEETGIAPGCLEIEITESVAMENIENTIARLNELAEMGVRVSIDDFGTGYSSLNYLKRLPIGKLKIDKSFIQDIATDSDDRAIITAVLLMAHSMKLKVVAEGVEQDGQLTFLRGLNCDEAQGFLFSKPVPADRFREMMAHSA